MLSDAEPALVSAIEKHFPKSAHNLCTHHADDYVKVQCRGYFYHGKESNATKPRIEGWNTFKSHWLQVRNSPTAEEYMANMEAFVDAYTHDDAKLEGIVYIRRTWFNANTRRRLLKHGQTKL